MYLDKLTKDEFRERVKDNPLVILPIGAVEEHGPHLPLATDALQAEHVAEELAERTGALIAPPIRYGVCRSTRNFPGTISISYSTLRELIREILSELVRHGIKRILVLSGHAGSSHMAALREAAQDTVDAHRDVRVVVITDYDIAYSLIGKKFPEGDGHSGAIETSRILNLYPELVKGTAPDTTERPPRYLMVPDPERYFPDGVLGFPSQASAEKGRELEAYILQELERIVSQHLSK